jgi:hypothetical protein
MTVVKFLLYRRIIPEAVRPEGTEVEWWLIALQWIFRPVFFLKER